MMIMMMTMAMLMMMTIMMIMMMKAALSSVPVYNPPRLAHI